MKKTASNEVKRGQTISFRVPSDTPDHILKHLQRLKEIERRNFSSKIAEYVMQGVGNTYTREKETITVPLPKSLSKVQRDWLKHEHSEVLLGSIIYQLIADPIRATSLLAAFNSNSLDIDEALYLQEETIPDFKSIDLSTSSEGHIKDTLQKSTIQENSFDLEDDLSNFNWEKVKKENQDSIETLDDDNEEDANELLGAFLAQMNK
jgi:hypothetical protein